VSLINAEIVGPGGVEAHRIKESVTRLREVRRRFVLDAGDGAPFALAEERLDSIIVDLEGWLKPGGSPVDVSGLGFRMAAVEQMIEAVGFPGYAHVVAGVRNSLVEPVEYSTAESAPPPPRRYVPPAASKATRPPASDVDADDWDLRAAAEERQRDSGWLVKVVLITCCVAVAWMTFSRREQTPSDPGAGVGGPVVEEVRAPVPTEPKSAPGPDLIPDPAVVDRAAEYEEALMERFSSEIALAESAMRTADLDSALSHFAAAAAIDRHHRRLTEAAGTLIDLLLREADEAFDDTRWDVAAARVEDARRIARGLYLDTSEIDQTARKHELMTRFEDVTPGDPGAFNRAVGRAVRVTSIYGDVLFGRLETFGDDVLLVEIHSGVAGGGAQYSTTIPVSMISELRIFEAQSVSETVLEP
jgi:hypothetical protein